MTSTIELNKRYEFLVDTLIMACAETKVNSDFELEGYLEELEGDYYTFFDNANLIDLYHSRILDDWQVNQIVFLKISIAEIQASLWSVDALKENLHWIKIRLLANDVLNSMGISKRTIA